MTNPADDGENPPTGWTNPGGTWGQPPSGGYTSPGEGAQQGHTPPPPQTPPTPQVPLPHPSGGYVHAQPGIIPLQPLTLGQIYDGAFKAIRANPAVMFIFAGVVLTVTTVIELALSASFLSDYFSVLDAFEEDPEALVLSGDDLLGMFSGSVLPLILGAILSFIASTLLTGILTFAVSQAVLGFKPTLAQVWDQAKGQLLRLLGLVFLIGLLTVSVPLVLVGVTVAVATSGSVGLSVLVGLLGAAASLVWVLFIIPVTALTTPALMLERSGPITALKRGWVLAKPFFWRVLGIYLLTSLIAMMVTYIIAMPISIVSLFLPPSGVLIAQGVATVISATLVTPFTAGVVALMYIDIRIRREGLATELAAAAAR